MAEDFVDYKILIDAVQAVEALRELTANATSFKERLDLVKASVRQFSEETGMSLRNTARAFESLDKGIAETTRTSTIFGSESKAGWNQAGQAATDGANKIFNAASLIRSVFHVLVIGALFEFANVAKKIFGEVVNNIRESELAVYNLVNAEKRLSEQGIDVTPKGLQETVDSVKKLVPILSQIQSQELVSRVATNVAPALGFTDAQIKQLSESIALLYIRNKALGKSFDEVESQVTNAFLTGKVSQGINQLGVKITDLMVKEEAVNLQLINSVDDFDKLDGKVQAHVKSVAMLSIVYKNASQDMGAINSYMQTTDAQVEMVKTSWSDLITLLGKLSGPAIATGLSIISHAIQGWIIVLGKLKPVLADIMATWIAFGQIWQYQIENHFKVGAKDLINKFAEFKNQNLDKIMKSFGDAADTATAPVDSLSSAVGRFVNNAKAMKEVGDKLADILQENKDKLADIERQYQEKQQDIARNYSQKLQDIDIAVARKRADALTDYNNKVVDINNDASKKTVEAKQEAKKKEIEIEQKYQQELKNLQQKYLMDLEEALHNRDARQILRLMRQYAFDKQALEEKRKQDRQEAKVELAQKLQDIENERKEKLAAAQREYQEKLKEIQLYLQRERQDAQTALRREMEDARIAHERTLAEQRLYLQRKLRDLADALMKEYNLTKTMVEAIFKLWAAKYGTSLPSFPTTASPTSGGTSSGSSFASFSATQAAVTGGMGYGLAEGGSFLATTPTKLNVAENGPELISATPLGKVGSDLNKLFMQMGGAKDSGSSTNAIELGVTLSPDLETRIIKKSLDEAASVVMRVNRGAS